MREERLRVFENRLLREVFGAKREEVTGDWRKLHNEELNNLYCSSKIFSGDQIDKTEMGGACSTYRVEDRYIQGFGGET
jgi:hypothetical protein